MLRFDFHVSHHDVRRKRVVSQDELSAVQKVKIPEPRPLQYHEVRVRRGITGLFTISVDPALLRARPRVPDDSSIRPTMLK